MMMNAQFERENELLSYKQKLMMEFSNPEACERVKLANEKVNDAEKELSLLKQQLKYRDCQLNEAKKSYQELTKTKTQLEVRLEEMTKLGNKLKKELDDTDNQENNTNLINQIKTQYSEK